MKRTESAMNCEIRAFPGLKIETGGTRQCC